MTPTLFARILGDSIYLAQKGYGVIKYKMCAFYHTRNFSFIKHMPKMSGYPNKSVFMLRIKGGMKKGGGLRSQNCFYLGTLTFFA